MKKESNAFALDSFFHITLLILKITNTKYYIVVVTTSTL